MTYTAAFVLIGLFWVFCKVVKLFTLVNCHDKYGTIDGYRIQERKLYR